MNARQERQRAVSGVVLVLTCPVLIVEKPTAMRPHEFTAREQVCSASDTKIWDLFVRSFHWLLVLAVAAAAITGFLTDARWADVHVWAGTAIAVLVGARLVWGLAGSTHARFASFAPGLSGVLHHLIALKQGRASRHLGHNPLGALMIFALLGILVALVATGVVVLGGVLKSGPAASFVSYVSGNAVREIHEVLAVGLLCLVALHVAGVISESLRTRENLVAAMWSGRKDRRNGDDAVAPRLAHPALATAIILAGGGLLAAEVMQLNARTAFGVPAAPLDPLYVQECGACHVAYHPSLLPRQSWAALLDGLDNHFGEDASLDGTVEVKLRDYLNANAAEAYDTKAANRLRRVDVAAPFTITQTPFWKHVHRHIPANIFASAPIRTAGNCNACHSDAATGRFYPGNISIPKDVSP